ncbi:hypothetical protein D3C83_37100 [compost metagenome]
MKRFALITIGAALALALPSLSWAQQRDLEVTMDVVPANAAPAAATGEIKLPDSASDRGREASAFGLGVANKAREMRGELGREFGKSVSESARERGLPPIVPGKP